MGFNIFGKIPDKLSKDDEYIRKLEEKLTKLEQPKKSKRKMNFDNLFPAPRDQGNSMGMDNIAPKGKKPFQGVF